MSMIGLAADTVDGALAAMRRLAPRKTSPAFHHVVLSPSRTCSNNCLREDADRVLREMGADPETHPHLIVIHGKTSVAGRGASHAHLVVAHWQLDGQALDDGWLRLRLERLAREIEHDRSQPLIPGRHDRALAKALRARNRPEVAEALEVAGGAEPPRSATTPKGRQKLLRDGIDDVAARMTVQSAWASTSDPEAFRAALADTGLAIAPGDKAGVWIVTANNGVVVGALDRIVREKRAAVAVRMEKKDEQPIPQPRPGTPAPDENYRRPDERTSPAPGASGGTRGAEPSGGSARSPDRHTDRATRDDRPTWPDRNGPSARAAASTGRGRRLREVAAARLLRKHLNLAGLRNEASRRYLAGRLSALEEIYTSARRQRDDARAVPPKTIVAKEARLRHAKAEKDRRRADEAAAAAEDRRQALLAALPRGWRLVWWWTSGRLRRHHTALAEAAATAREATAIARARAEVVNGMARIVETEEAKAMRRQRDDIRRRREAEEAASLTMKRAEIAADLLRSDPTRGALVVPDLLRLAEVERRRRETAENARNAQGMALQPR